MENRKSCCLRMAPEVRKLWRHRIRCLVLRQLGLLSLRACVAMRALRDSRPLGALRTAPRLTALTLALALAIAASAGKLFCSAMGASF